MIGARWRPPLRIARRTARRALGRTFLVAALVGVPVLGATFLDTVVRTADLPTTARAERQMGAADGLLSVTPFDRVAAIQLGDPAPEREPRRRDPATVDLGRLLPPGSRVVPAPARSTVRLEAGGRATLTGAVQLDTRDPITAGLYALRAGRFPARPGELVLSPALAERIDVGVGGRVRPASRPAATVVGLAVNPNCRSCQLAIGLPGWTGGGGSGGTGGSGGSGGAGAVEPPNDELFLLDLPAGPVADLALRNRLAASGVLLVARDEVLHPERWATDRGNGDTTALAVALLVAGVGLVEVVLLAGTAFAVAARRQVRDVALVLSNGGRRSDVRRMLLAQGAVLGLLGGLAGAGTGVLAVLAGWRGLQRLTDRDFAGLIVSWRDLTVVAAVGLLSGVTAAAVPAWSASRVPVLVALGGRYGRPSRTRRRLAAGGASAAAAGLLLAALVSWRWAAARAAYVEQPEAPPPGLLYPAAMLVGFALAMLGLTVLAPTLVGLAGRAAGRLPLTGRLAVRDAARHRHRTGPAMGAVMVAVAGSVAVAFAVASYDARDRGSYLPQLPTGWVSVPLMRGDLTPTEDEQLAAVRAAAAELPTTGVVPVVVAAPAPQPPYEPGSATWDPADPAACADFSSQVGVGAATARLVGRARADEAAAAVAAGKAVITDPCLVSDGEAVLRIGVGRSPASPEDGKLGPSVPADRLVRLPAVVLPGIRTGLPTGVVGAQTARRAGLIEQVSELVVVTSRTPTEAEEDRARAALGVLGDALRVERGYGAPYLPGFLALIGGAGLVTLAGVAISVTLSAAEGRADMATLAAVGAPPRRRRGLAMAQAALVAGLGAGLGVLLGAAIGTTIMFGLDGYPLVVPWRTVLLSGVGVPALGVLAAGLLTRSRLPLVRRLA